MTTRTITVEARRLIEEAASRGAHDDCMDALLFTLEESGYVIRPAEPAGEGYEWDCPNCGEHIHSWTRPPALAPAPAGAGLREALEDRPHEHEWVEVTTLGDKQRRWICSSSELAGCRAERREVAATPGGESEHWRGADGGERE